MKAKLFLTKITVNHKLIRKTNYRFKKETDIQKTRFKEWESKELKKPIEVTIIGKRNLYNGISWFEALDGDSGVYLFEPKECIKAYLVVQGISRKPFYVMVNNCTTN